VRASFHVADYHLFERVHLRADRVRTEEPDEIRVAIDEGGEVGRASSGLTPGATRATRLRPNRPLAATQKSTPRG